MSWDGSGWRWESPGPMRPGPYWRQQNRDWEEYRLTMEMYEMVRAIHDMVSKLIQQQDKYR
jgi:hypothetical protein